jgi:hypothetical protein
MQNRKPKPQSADNYFELIANAELQELALALRRTIKQTLPGVEECVKWDLPFFSLHGNLCYLNIRQGRVELGLYRGVYLSNANGLLQGDGKLIKHIVLSADEDIPVQGIQEILHEAVELNKKAPLKLKKP